MLITTLVAQLLAIPLSSITPAILTRLTSIGLVYAALLSMLGASASGPVSGLDAGLGLYSGLIHATTLTQGMEVFLFSVGALILLPWASSSLRGVGGTTAVPSIPEYPMIIVFTTLGSAFLLSTADLVSLYLAIELQSFGVYILAALYRDSESATSAGLKYFLLGALSSALILLGSGLVYGYTGLTNLDSLFELVSVPGLDGVTDSYTIGLLLGLALISVGLLFKIAAAPFHYWAPDVYDGVPTIVTTWLTIMPKIGILVVLLELYRGVDISGTFLVQAKDLLLISSFLSLIIGTVGGLGQFRVKRLLAYSTISHVGFLLLALALSATTVAGGTDALSALLFYLIQYSLTNLDAFCIILAFGYLLRQTHIPPAGPIGDGSVAGVTTRRYSPGVGARKFTEGDVEFLSDLKGQFRSNPLLGLSLAITLFSMAGVPPMVGFFAKYTVLSTALQNGYVFLSVVGILTSVISAAYYLRIIRLIHFDVPATSVSTVGPSVAITSVHSYLISVLTLFVLLFAVNPNLILNSTNLMALSLVSSG